MPFEVLQAPHVNVNDLTLKLVRWAVRPWQAVEAGSLLCELETTKATIEFASDRAGFVLPAVEPGRLVRVGEPLAYVFPSADPEQARELDAGPTANSEIVVSRKALDLMDRFGLSPVDFPRHTAIGSDTVLAMIRERGLHPLDGPTPAPGAVPAFGPDDIVLWGETNLATLAWDALQAGGGGRAAAYVPDQGGGALFDLPVLVVGQWGDMKRAGLRKVFPCAAGRAARTAQLAELSRLGFDTVTVIHPSAVVSAAARLGVGCFVGAGAKIGPLAEIGDGTSVLAGAGVAHPSRVGAHCAISDGAHLGGNVTVGDGAVVGIGAAVNKRVTIGEGALVVSGAAAFDDVPAGAVLRRDGVSVSRP
jgi:UDP-perosamine 4-acetyltransferase